MLGYRLLRDVEVPADLSCRARLIPHQSEHRLAARLGQGPQRGLAAHVTKCDSRCSFNQVLTCTSLDLYIPHTGRLIEETREDQPRQCAYPGSDLPPGLS